MSVELESYRLRSLLGKAETTLVAAECVRDQGRVRTAAGFIRQAGFPDLAATVETTLVDDIGQLTKEVHRLYVQAGNEISVEGLSDSVHF